MKDWLQETPRRKEPNRSATLPRSSGVGLPTWGSLVLRGSLRRIMAAWGSRIAEAIMPTSTIKTTLPTSQAHGTVR